MKEPSKAVQEAVERATADLLNSISDPDAATRAAVSRAAELTVLSQECRASALAGHPVVTSDLLRLEQMASEAVAALNIKPKTHAVDELRVVFVNQKTVNLPDAAHARLEDLATKLEQLPPTCTPEDMHAALMQLELRDREIDELKAELLETQCKLAKATGADEPQTLMGQLMAPPKKLPAPVKPADPPYYHFDPIARGGINPALDTSKRDWPTY